MSEEVPHFQWRDEFRPINLTPVRASLLDIIFLCYNFIVNHNLREIFVQSCQSQNLSKRRTVPKT